MVALVWVLTLSFNTSPVPTALPVSVPPIVKLETAQVTAMLVTFALATPVAPPVTEQDSVGFAGWPVTETL